MSIGIVVATFRNSAGRIECDRTWTTVWSVWRILVECCPPGSPEL
jgi:hypothetical protein